MTDQRATLDDLSDDDRKRYLVEAEAQLVAEGMFWMWTVARDQAILVRVKANWEKDQKGKCEL